MPRTVYKLLAEDHPGAAGQILKNLLQKVEQMAGDAGQYPAL